jgi:hypothetical protein
MKRPGQIATTIAVAGLIAVVAAVPSNAQTKRARYAYDGLWSVSIRTQFGPCDPSYRYPARIVAG